MVKHWEIDEINLEWSVALLSSTDTLHLMPEKN